MAQCEFCGGDVNQATNNCNACGAAQSTAPAAPAAAAPAAPAGAATAIQLTNYKGTIRMVNPTTGAQQEITKQSTAAVALFGPIYMLFWRKMWLHGLICLFVAGAGLAWIPSVVYAFLFKKLIVKQYQDEGYVVVFHDPEAKGSGGLV